MENIAVFASGRGSNFRKIYQNINKGEVPAQISCLITDNSSAGAISFAEQKLIPVYTISPKDFSSSEKFGEAVLQILKKYLIAWIILAGYLKKIPDNVFSNYSNRVLNIHPALLPSFGGRGMYGMHVHQAVFNSGAKISGVTVHLINNEYDAGPIVMQQAVDIQNCKSPDEIAKKVLKIEHKLYSKAVQKILTTKFHISGKRVIFQSKS